MVSDDTSLFLAKKTGKPKLPWSNVRGSLNQSAAGSAAGSSITMATEQESSGFTLLVRVSVQFPLRTAVRISSPFSNVRIAASLGFPLESVSDHLNALLYAASVSGAVTG